MSILDKVKIGNSVQVNLELSKDRLTKETIDAINVSSLGKISFVFLRVLTISIKRILEAVLKNRNYWNKSIILN